LYHETRGRGDRFLSLKGELEGGTFDQGKRLEMANLDCVRLGVLLPIEGVGKTARSHHLPDCPVPVPISGGDTGKENIFH
jgi:hypothetical protein